MAGPVRQQFNIPGLQDFLKQKVPAIKTPVDVKQFGYGQSNPTYLLKDQDGNSFVLRKKPPGKLMSKTAHRVDREYKILHSLESTDVPVPKTYCFCDDDSVIGTPFYIMEFLKGRIFDDPAIPNVSAEHRSEMWHDAIRTLAKFHRVDPVSVNMSDYGRPNNFYNRQIKLFKDLSSIQAGITDADTDEPVGMLNHFDEMLDFFENPKSQPKDRATFIHGDYKIDNMVFHPTEPRVIGILDWEMSTIGHPLADLTNVLTPYVTAGNPKAQEMSKSGKAASNPAFLANTTPGLPTIDQCIEWYSEVAGWDPKPDRTWGDAFNVFKGSIIMQGIAARYAMRQASSEQAKMYGSAMQPYADVAWDLVQHAIQDAKSQSKL